MRNLDSEFRERREQLLREENRRRRRRVRRRVIRIMVLIPICMAAAAFAFYHFLLKPGIVEIHLPAHTESEGPTIAEQFGERWDQLTEAFRPKWGKQETGEETAAAETPAAEETLTGEEAETPEEPAEPAAESSAEPSAEPTAEEPAEATEEELPAAEIEGAEEVPEETPAAEQVQPSEETEAPVEVPEEAPVQEPEESEGQSTELPTEPPAEEPASEVQQELPAPETEGADAVLADAAEEGGEQPETEEPQPSEEPSYAPFELPVAGAAGFAAFPLSVMSPLGEETALLQPGESFVIQSQAGSLYRIRTGDGKTGYVRQENVLVNLPDVIPSILYNNLNGSASALRSGETKLPGITGEALYASRFYNERLGREEYVVPVLTGTAQKLAKAQKAALSAGCSLMVFEGWHSLDVQERIAQAFHAAGVSLPNGVEEVWFTGEDRFNYHLGCGVDVTLVRIVESEEAAVGDYHVPKVTKFSRRTMPGPVGDLSPVSFAFYPPVSALDGGSWQRVPAADTMTEDALLLQRIMTESGFTPLSSAWWHFNDLEARAAAEPADPGVSYELGRAEQELPH